MKNKHNLFITIFLFVLAICNPTFALTSSINKVVFFGDSLTDTGNLYRYDFGFLPKSPPYSNGRFTNGIVWSEYVADRLKLKNISTENYALGGETVALHSPIGGFLPVTLSMSVKNYLSHNNNLTNTLFVI